LAADATTQVLGGYTDWLVPSTASNIRADENNNAATYNVLAAQYARVRADYIANHTVDHLFDETLNFVGVDSPPRTAASDADVAKAASIAASGDYIRACGLLRASIESLGGYVDKIAGVNEEIKTQAEAVKDAIKDAIPQAITGAEIAVGVVVGVLVLVILVKVL